MQVKVPTLVICCLILASTFTASNSHSAIYHGTLAQTANTFQTLWDWLSDWASSDKELGPQRTLTVAQPAPKPETGGKADYTVDVGMWYVNMYNLGDSDKTLNSSVPELKRLWDGHPKYPVRACNLIQTGGGGEHWGYLPGKPRAKREAHGYNEWMRCLQQVNAESRAMKSLVFRALWGLRKEREWSISEIELMTSIFLEMSARTSTLDAVAGWVLGDDFADYPYHKDWDTIVKTVHEQQQQRQLNKPFYFTNQLFAKDIWSSGAPRRYRLRRFKKWLKVFNDTGAVPVFVPQYYPWASSNWEKRPHAGQYKWWKAGLDELQVLKDSFCPKLRVQPIIQGIALKINSGPKHIDMRNQLRAVLDHPVTDGVWILGWRPIGVPGNRVFWASREHWTTGINIAEAIQVTVGGAEREE